MLITRKIEIDYGHTLPNHFSFCNQLHGHRGVIEAGIEGNVCIKEGDSSQGMVLDFKIIKQIMMEEIHEVLDHGFAVWEKDKEDLDFVVKRNKKVLITSEPPTAEYLAKWAFYKIKKRLPLELKLKYLIWGETPNSTATYEEVEE